jgi:nitrile hydratase accessory protein
LLNPGKPWQAQAFALAVKLSEQGHFTWQEWVTTLADELRAAASGGEPETVSRRQWSGRLYVTLSQADNFHGPGFW